MTDFKQNKTDTIVALSSGQGRAAISVFRFSGPNCDAILEKLMGAQRLPVLRISATRWIYDDQAKPIDHALVLRFQSPSSYTGEDMAEIHCHGGLAIQEAFLETVLAFDDCRLAEPGEFTRRAFENGKLDLLQAEGVGDLIDAETPAQRDQAINVYEGLSSLRIENWRKSLLRMSALLAAAIDFPDEGDIPDAVYHPVISSAQNLIEELKGVLGDGEAHQRIREGIRIAIIGKPNAGKSTLINALVGRDVAIVSDIEGTTRDVIEQRMIIAGVPVLIADTAGLRESDDEIERLGVQKARDWAGGADIILRLIPSNSADTLSEDGEDTITIRTKSDLSDNLNDGRETNRFLHVSAKTGQGMDELVDKLQAEIKRLTSVIETPIITRQRHREGIVKASSALVRLTDCLALNDADLAAFELEQAKASLARLVGRVDVEDVLGELFSGFCIGK